MTTYRVPNLKHLGPLIRRHMNERERRITKAVHRTATQGAAHVRRHVPVAFSELRDSVGAKPDQIYADAPHAAPVEEGSRPHTPPLEPLIRWVKLRHLEGVTIAKRPRTAKRLPGTTTEEHATAVHAALGASWKRSDVESNYRAMAFKIQQGIAKHGTRPHFYMAGSMPVVMEILDREIRAALPDRRGS